MSSIQTVLTARERKLIPSECYLLELGTSIHESKISLLLSAARVLNKTSTAKRADFAERNHPERQQRIKNHM